MAVFRCWQFSQNESLLKKIQWLYSNRHIVTVQQQNGWCHPVHNNGTCVWGVPYCHLLDKYNNCILFYSKKGTKRLYWDLPCFWRYQTEVWANVNWLIWRWYGERQNMSSITKTMRHVFKYILLHCCCLKMRSSNVSHLSLLLQTAGRPWLSTIAYLSLILTSSSFLKEVLALYRVDLLEKAQISLTQLKRGNRLSVTFL